MILFPNAKINLGLNVIGKRPDGFHNIETLMYPIGLSDALEIIPSGNNEAELTVTGIPVEGDVHSNLCMRAYSMLKEEHQIPGVTMHLHKVIPTGAGLGGGSSDGACTIRILNELFELQLTTAQMIGYARRLGSDCAFFIENKPVFATGRGDQFEPVDVDLQGYTLVVMKPPVEISTAKAYARIKPAQPLLSVKEIIGYPVDTWAEFLKNDFEPPVIKENEIIGMFKTVLYDTGAFYVSMSGSGSAVYGLFYIAQPRLYSPGTFMWQEVL
jgi:4-diphosphocytidyl-2-C-methyl-D-erythritol kinase